MKRLTVDFGIDLGTTNSTIAVLNGDDVTTIMNSAGSVVTPSAVWIDKRGNVHVGAEAKERTLTEDPDNGDIEFKLRMGTRGEGDKLFARSGKVMSPEALSAEVLKSLKLDVQTSHGENVYAAVITVPAAFELPQSSATRRSACGTTSEDLMSGHVEMLGAGFKQCVLLLEPVAASLAYGFQSASENAYWLVYDFGGGTFDAALMRIRDGMIQVVNHDGDNHLGGKLIDWDIVSKYLIPELRRQFTFADLDRGVQKWQRAIGRLKYAAERAKIEVCRTRQSTDIWIEDLCIDDAGVNVDFAFSLTPEILQDVARPYVERSLGLCRKVLKDKGLTGENLERILMVGGTTLNPWIRESVGASLGASLDFSIDPVTVVARGAAIFAGTQRLLSQDTTVPEGTWSLDIEHEPVGNVQDPDVGGRITSPTGGDVAGVTIEFVDLRTKWRSGKVAVNSTGVFMTTLFADDRRRCEYSVELCDATGTRLQVQPERIAYTLGLVPDKPPASNSIGIGKATGDYQRYVSKGTKLPTRGRHDHRTTRDLRAGNAEDVIRIPVLEGENDKAIRNHLIGELVVRGTDIKRDVPAGSQVEVTVYLDESQTVRVEGYFPALDEDFRVLFDLEMKHSSLDTLLAEVKLQKDRLREAKERSTDGPSVLAGSVITRIEDEQLESQVDSLAEAAKSDQDARQQLDRRLRDLAVAVDELEDAAELPNAVNTARERYVMAEELILEHGEPADVSKLDMLRQDLDRAVVTADIHGIRRISEQLVGLFFQVSDGLVSFHIARFQHLCRLVPTMTNQSLAIQLVQQGTNAISDDNVSSLKNVIGQLISLLPKTVSDSSDTRIGDVI